MRKVIFASLLLLSLSVAAGDKRFSYMLARSDDDVVMSGNVDISRIEEMVNRFDRPYLWARVDGRQYLIRDAATMAEARAAFLDADKLHAEYERLHAKMRPLEEKEEALEDEIDKLEDSHRDASHLRAQLRPITKQLRELEDEEERIDDREEKLVEAAEAKLKEIVEQAIRRGTAERLR